MTKDGEVGREIALYAATFVAIVGAMILGALAGAHTVSAFVGVVAGTLIGRHLWPTRERQRQKARTA
jgi:hypothetical protein